MSTSHRLAAGFIVIAIHAVFLFYFSSSVLPQPPAEATPSEALVVVLLKPRLILESKSYIAAQAAPLKLSANAIVDLSLPPPEALRPLKITAGVGTLAAGPGAPELLPDPKPFAARAGLTPGDGATVVLRVEVLEDNELGQIVVEVSGGSAVIDEAAIAYARSMPWIGAVVDGRPVPMRVRYAVHLQA